MLLKKTSVHYAFDKTEYGKNIKESKYKNNDS